MRHSSNGLDRLTVGLFFMIVCCLAVAAFSGLFESPLLAYFWYLALLGMAAMVVLTVLLAAAWFLDVLSRRYHQILLHWNEGVPGH
jgi:hypothetical protein